MNDLGKVYTKKKISVNWTGRYPNLCSGEWEIYIDGIKMVDKTQDEYSYGGPLRENMNTYGTYSSWHFEDWSEVFEDYEAGLFFDEWLTSPEGKKLLEIIKSNGVELTPTEVHDLYHKIQENDWRSGSCGGCI